MGLDLGLVLLVGLVHTAHSRLGRGGNGRSNGAVVGFDCETDNVINETPRANTEGKLLV